MIKIGLLGAKGRMGQWVARLLESEFSDQAILSSTVGRGDSLDPLLETDGIIDFSSSSFMASLASFSIQTNLQKNLKLPVFVVGSTGWTAENQILVQKLSEKTPVLQASNFSEGIFLICDFLKQATPVLKKLGYQSNIIETHHRHKKDAPSGTALTLQKAIGEPTEIHSIRAGEVIGEHEVVFHGKADSILISHKAQDRSLFARGAIRSAIWLAQNRNKGRFQSGMFGMEHVYQDLRNLKECE